MTTLFVREQTTAQVNVYVQYKRSCKYTIYHNPVLRAQWNDDVIRTNLICVIPVLS